MNLALVSCQHACFYDAVQEILTASQVRMMTPSVDWCFYMVMVISRMRPQEQAEVTGPVNMVSAPAQGICHANDILDLGVSFDTHFAGFFKRLD